MRVIVTNHTNNKTKVYEGATDLICRHLKFDYPFLRTGDVELDNDLPGLMDTLDTNQMFSVEVEHDIQKTEKFNGDETAQAQIVNDMLGFEPDNTPEFIGAAFLAGVAPISTARQSFYEADGDVEAAALRCYGLEVNDKNLTALRAVKRIQDLNKSEDSVTPPTSIEAAMPEGEDVAQAVTKAFHDRFVFRVNLSGKHSKGSLLAHDDDSGVTWLLKPGSGGAGMAAGVQEEKASSAAREATFYQVAKELELYEWYPRAELLLIDGQPVAAMKLLPWTFKTGDRMKKQDPLLVRNTLQPLLADGTLHKWAALDFILGNPDDHLNNLMMDTEGGVRLIDHGSAFAGSSFDPANDKNSFIPGYLRVWGPDNFRDLPYKERNRYMPRLAASIATRLGAWINSIHSEEISSILHRYGIDPQPTLDRLAKLKTMVMETPADRAINTLWLTV